MLFPPYPFYAIIKFDRKLKFYIIIQWYFIAFYWVSTIPAFYTAINIIYTIGERLADADAVGAVLCRILGKLAVAEFLGGGDHLRLPQLRRHRQSRKRDG